MDSGGNRRSRSSSHGVTLEYRKCVCACVRVRARSRLVGHKGVRKEKLGVFCCEFPCKALGFFCPLLSTTTTTLSRQVPYHTTEHSSMEVAWVLIRIFGMRTGAGRSPTV